MGMLDHQVAVITGSSRGLGLAIAELYASQGAAVIISARSEQTVAEAVNQLRKSGYQASGLVCDVGSLEQVRALADHAVKTYGKIDIWVNNAGVAGVYGPTAHVPVGRFERVFRTNILGTYYGSIVAVQQFLRQGSGKLINLLGRGDDGPVKFQNAYASSKYWVRSFTLALAEEYKTSGIGIYAFNPGLVDTALLRQVDALTGYERKLKPLSMVIRLWANAPEVPAQKALWLVSPATNGKTGLVVSVLSRRRLFTGLLRDLKRRLTHTPAPDTSLDITSVLPVMPLPRPEK